MFEVFSDLFESYFYFNYSLLKIIVSVCFFIKLLLGLLDHGKNHNRDSFNSY